MSGRGASDADVSDAELADQVRGGMQRAFAELWRRHYQAGVRAARHCTSSIDADDLVSEAFTRIYRTMQSGGGPTSAFRPYLYTTIRNIAATWGAASRDITVDDFTEFEAPGGEDDPAAVALDRTLTARAFRSLPDRWQSVLWYTEVEGMDPHEVAPILGMSANGVAALAYRAREGLRRAWLQAHVSDATAAGECKWAIAKLGDRARNSLTAKDSERMDFHLATCGRCAIISEEVEEVGSHLAAVLFPIVLGGGAGGALLASMSAGSTATVAAALAPMPEMVVASGGVVGAGTAGVLSGPVAVVGSLAVAFTLAGTAVVAVPQLPETTTVTSAESTIGGDTSADEDAGRDEATVPTDNTGGVSDDPANIPDLTPVDTPPTQTVDGGAGDLDGLTDSIVDTITGGAPPEGHTAPGGALGTDIDLDLLGTATPGAHLSLQALGQVYATTTVAADGTFVLNATAIPEGLTSLELVQEVDRSYLATLLPGGGVLEQTLGTLDALVNALIRPIHLGSGGEGVTIVLVG